MEAFNQGADWLAGEIPDVVSQLLLWNSVSSFLTMLIGMLILSGAYKLGQAARKEVSKGDREKDLDIVYGCGFSAAIVVVIGAITFFEGLDWLKIWIAPKLYLLEYAADLVK